MPPRKRRHFDGWAAASGRPVISFRGEYKYVDGVRYTATGLRQSLSSNGKTIYTSIMWSDGKASCNCPGWANSKQYDAYGQPKDKMCAHSKDVRAGDDIRIGAALPTAPDWTLGVEAAPKKRKIIL